MSECVHVCVCVHACVCACVWCGVVWCGVCVCMRACMPAMYVYVSLCVYMLVSIRGFDKCSPLARCRSFRHDIFTCVSGRNFKFALKCPEKIQEIMRDNSNKSEKNTRFVF